MMQVLVVVLLLINFCTGYNTDACPNGIFKCESLSTLRLCYEGQPMSTELSCPENLICSEDSDKLCIEAASPLRIEKSAFVCEEEGSFYVENSCCKKYHKCLKKFPTGFRAKELSCIKDEYFDPEIQFCTKSYVCPEKCETPQCANAGKFVILNTECKKYLICKQTTNGLKGTEKSCFFGASFNSASGKCEKNYICNDTDSSIITSNSTITFPSIDITLFTESTTTTSTSTPTDTTIFTDTTLTDIPFICAGVGKYLVLNSNCTKFYLCSLKDNKLVYEIYDCPNDTKFNLDTSRCTRNYTCPTDPIINDPCTTASITCTEPEKISNSTFYSETPTNPTISDEFITTTTTPFIPNDPSTTTTYESTTTSIATEDTSSSTVTIFIPIGDSSTTTSTITSTEGSTISSTSSSNEDITTTTTPFIVSDSTTTASSTKSPQINCTAQGKHPIPATNCKRFLSCILTTKGFIQTEFECLNGTYFDPKVGKCIESYICEESVSSKSPLPPVTTKSPSTTRKPFRCEAQGKFPVNDTNCKNYIICVLSTNGFTEAEFKCKDGYLFDPVAKLCRTNYICPETKKVRLTTLEIKNVCFSAGKHPVKNSGCKKYTLCAKTIDGYIQKDYECPGDSLFDPTTNKCSLTYVCVDEFKCDSDNNGNTNCKLKEYSNESNFICTNNGKYPVSKTDCRSYIECIAHNKNYYTAFEHNCPSNKLFNPSTTECDENYICPEFKNFTTIKCSTIGNYPYSFDQNCEYYYKCIEVTPNQIVGYKLKCNQGSFFDPEIQECSSKYICHTKKELQARSLYQDVMSTRFLVNGRCTTIGRYMVDLTNCKNYVYCRVDATGRLISTNFTCPTTTVFNQATQKCVTNYICPDQYCVNNPGFLSWPNPNVRDCSSYIDCEPVMNDFFIIGYKGVIKYCPTGMYFDPVLAFCDSMYVCPST